MPAPLAAGAWFWFRLSSIFGVLFFPMLSAPKGPWLPIALFALSLPVLWRDLTGAYIFENIVRAGDNWVFVPAAGSFWMYYWTAYELLMIVVCLSIIFLRTRRAPTRREKRQSIAIFIFVSAGISLGMIEAYLFAPLLNIPSFSPVFGTFCILGIWIAMLRYRLLSVTDKKVCRDMLETMDAFIVMLDSEERVVMTNRTAERLLGQSLKDTAGKLLAAIIGDSADCREALANLRAGRPAPGSCQVSVDNGKTELALRFSPVKDAAGDPLGFMVLGHELKGVRHFLKRFQNTAREWEAIHKLVTGATNREIADTLSIAERTVKAHLSNVYGKLGVENKVQLIGVLKEHGLY